MLLRKHHKPSSELINCVTSYNSHRIVLYFLFDKLQILECALCKILHNLFVVIHYMQPLTNAKHFHHLVAEVIDHFDGNATSSGFVERT